MTESLDLEGDKESDGKNGFARWNEFEVLMVDGPVLIRRMHEPQDHFLFARTLVTNAQRHPIGPSSPGRDVARGGVVRPCGDHQQRVSGLNLFKNPTRYEEIPFLL